MNKEENKNEHEETAENSNLKQELEETRNRLLRALADFDNFKKRTAAEREQLVQFANEGLISELLPILDNFERALAAGEKSGAGEEMLKGLALLSKQLEDVLKKHGVEEIKALGEIYDPHRHEAVLKKEGSGRTGEIIEVMQKGYTLNGRVIRPSMVIVNK